MTRILLRIANALVSIVVLLSLTIAGAYAGYALWDNSRIYSAAEDVQADMIKLKPKTEKGEDGPTFAELLNVNPDVCGWVTLDNTKIDHPIVQGQDNMCYINTDVYGNFSLAGSIFLDSRNQNDFSDTVSLLYGHHMEHSGMFGDLDLYKDPDFFRENKTGTLITPDETYDLEIFACLLTEASDKEIFEPTDWHSNNLHSFEPYIQENALSLRQDVLDALLEQENPHILVLSTCSSEFTDARTIVLATMTPHRLGAEEEA